MNKTEFLSKSETFEMKESPFFGPNFINNMLKKIEF